MNDLQAKSTNTLALCPFCGGEASKRLFYKGKYRVHCNVCDAHSGDTCDTEAEAIAAWNTRTDDYKRAAEYWQRMYEQTFAERTCHIETRNGDQYCTRCGDMVGTCDPASELFVSGNMVELWNYCPNCGAKVRNE